MILKDELDKKQVHKFQLNNLNVDFIENTLANNKEGIFNLPSKMADITQRSILLYLNKLHYREGYIFELKKRDSNNPINPMIYFRKYIV